jgi:5-methylcytosine-specific restriction endonuclease McrA
VSPPSEADQIRFLTNLQRILSEGQFTATYKFALLHSLADISVRRGDDSGDPLVVTTEEIAQHFVQLYWHQAKPFSGSELLRQNTGGRAAVISRIVEAQSVAPGPLSKVAHRRLHVWNSLIRKVEQTVRIMPLTKLQTVGKQSLDFLYSVAEDQRTITPRPGVVFCFRRFYGIARDLIRGGWLGFVRRHNVDALGTATELSEFLFPGSRVGLGGFEPILREVQGSECLYCRRRIRSSAEVDHFVPWSRYPVNLGENLVLAHQSCNQRKSDHLAAEEHLDAWTRRNQEHEGELRERLREAGLSSDLGTSWQVAVWAYEQVDHARGQLWVAEDELRMITPRWREILCA